MRPVPWSIRRSRRQGFPPAGRAIRAVIYPDLQSAADHMAPVRRAILPAPARGGLSGVIGNLSRALYGAASTDAANGGPKPRYYRITLTRLR